MSNLDSTDKISNASFFCSGFINCCSACVVGSDIALVCFSNFFGLDGNISLKN